jgi:transcriptional antiterminator Rof (Rho-off)
MTTTWRDEVPDLMDLASRAPAGQYEAAAKHLLATVEPHREKLQRMIDDAGPVRLGKATELPISQGDHGPFHYVVRSGTDPKKEYNVYLSAPVGQMCDCWDHIARELACKHILAALLQYMMPAVVRAAGKHLLKKKRAKNEYKGAGTPQEDLS